VNVEHHDAPPRTPDQALTPIDGAIVAALVMAMTAASVTGARDAMYGCFAAAGAWLLARLARQERAAKAQPIATATSANRFAASTRPAPKKGLRWALEATPVGYRLGIAGLGVAFAGLGGDVVWHTVFGVEDGIARVIAPFHLFLFTGAGLLLTSPLRATYASDGYDDELSLVRALPVILGLTLITALALFLFQWLSAFADWKPAVDIAALPSAVRGNPAVVQNLQMVVLARIMVSTLILIAALLVAVRRFRLPFGAMTLVYGVAATLTASLTNLKLYGGVLAAVFAGIVADACIRALRPSEENTAGARITAFVTSLTFAGAYFVALGVLHNRTWPFDLTIGTVGLTAIAGLTLSAVALPPRGPDPVAVEEEAELEPVVMAAPAPQPAPLAVPEPVVVADSDPEPEPEVIVAPEPEPEIAPAPARVRPRDPAVLQFASRVAGASSTREDPIETSVLCQLLSGASVAEVAEAFEPALASADVEGLIGATAQAYRDWAAAPLDHLDVVYLFLEATPMRVRTGDAGEHDLLAAWGVTRRGRRELLGLRAGSRDRATAWGALGAELVERGMHPPALIVADGAPGVWRVARELWPQAATQQSLSHALGEASEDLTAGEARELRTRFTAALEEARSATEAQAALEDIVDDLRETAPARMAVLSRRIERLTAHLAFPAEHHRRLRSADVVHRALADLSGTAGPMPLVWAVLDRNTKSARRMAMSLHAVSQIDRLRRRPSFVPDSSFTHDA
jgi:hypothetical protein